MRKPVRNPADRLEDHPSKELIEQARAWLDKRSLSPPLNVRQFAIADLLAAFAQEQSHAEQKALRAFYSLFDRLGLTMINEATMEQCLDAGIAKIDRLYEQSHGSSAEQGGWIATKDGNWPNEDEGILAEIAYFYQDKPVTEIIACYIDGEDLKTMGGDDIGWTLETIIRWIPLPAPPVAKEEGL